MHSMFVCSWGMFGFFFNTEAFLFEFDLPSGGFLV